MSGRGLLPAPFTSLVAPSSTPAGSVTVSDSVDATSPLPRHVLHASRTVRPVPRQREHVRSTAMGKMPCWKRTRPRPLHAPQFSGVVPGAAPVPRQSPHETTRS